MKNLGYTNIDPAELIKSSTTEYHLVDCSPDTSSKSGYVTRVTDDMARELALKILDFDDSFDADFADGVRSGAIPLKTAYIPIYFGHLDVERYEYNTVNVKRRTVWKLDDQVVAKSEWKDGVDIEQNDTESYSEEFGIPSGLRDFFSAKQLNRFWFSISSYHYGADPGVGQLYDLRHFNHPAAYQTYGVMQEALKNKVKKEWGDFMTKEQKKAVDISKATSILYLFKVYYYEGSSKGTSDASFLAINTFEFFSGTYMKGNAGNSYVTVDHYGVNKTKRTASKPEPRLSKEESAGISRYNRESAKQDRIKGAQHHGLFSTVISFLMLLVFFIVNMAVDKSGILRFIAVVLHVGVGVGIVVALKKVDAVYLKNKDGGDAKKAARLTKLYALATPLVVFVVLLIITLLFAK